VRDKGDKATAVAIAAAGNVIAKNMDDARSDALIGNAIKAVHDRLH